MTATAYMQFAVKQHNQHNIKGRLLCCRHAICVRTVALHFVETTQHVSATDKFRGDVSAKWQGSGSGLDVHNVLLKAGDGGRHQLSLIGNHTGTTSMAMSYVAW
jgi:hypothetical protein